jgi:hypothetical protein
MIAKAIVSLIFWSVLVSRASIAFSQEAPLSQILPSETLVDPMYMSCNGLTQYAMTAQKWEKDVRALIETPAGKPGTDSILFLGSSSIRLWKTIDQDIAPFQPIRKGYGGAKYCDLSIYTPALVRGLQYRAAVLFVGNDVEGKAADKEPYEVERLCKIVIESVRREQPQAKLLIIGVTPTPSRFQHWGRIDAVNQQLKQLVSQIPDTRFLDTKPFYLNTKGEPRPELFGDDRLHQNEAGYKLWGSLISKELTQLLRP